MAQEKSLRPKGSIILKLLVVVFFGLMLVSIFTPKAQWEEQEKERDDCRLRMENLSYTIREYGVKNLGYVDDLQTYLDFISTDTVEFQAARYEIESLVRDLESGKDSLLLDFTDDFHLSHFEWKQIRPLSAMGDSIITDSMHVRAIPHDQFEKIPVSILVLTCESPIQIEAREKNIFDHALLVWAGSRINYDWIRPEPELMMAQDALISIPINMMAACPATKTAYKLNVNVRSVLEGLARFTVKAELADSACITQDTLMVDLLNHRIKTDALAEVLVIVKDDSSMIPKKDSLLVDIFVKKVTEIKANNTFDVTGDYTINVPADSMVNWDNPTRIRRAVFKAHVDSLSNVLKSIPEFLELMPKVTYSEIYKVAKIDTVGVTIQCPIDSSYVQPDKTFMDMIFGVGAPDNHGTVDNGDLSWSEKK
ncbi:MAG: hypothetical protein ABIE92_05375 [bacterium]